MKKSKIRLALGLVLLSGVFWFSMLAVPFVPLPLSAWQKGALAFALFFAAEVAFWVGALLVGKDLIYRYLAKLWPTSWTRRRPQLAPEPDETIRQRSEDEDAEPTLWPGHEDNGTVEHHEGEA